MTDQNLVRVRLRSVRLSLDSDDYVGKVLEVRADVAAAWIADGFAEAVDASTALSPARRDQQQPTTPPAPPRRRGSAR
jgi:hypothetical protein